MPKEIYCGIKKVPKGKRLGTMKECAEKGQISYYGLKKVDPKLIESIQKGAEKKESRDKLAINMVRLRGRVSKLKKDILGTKNQKEKEKLKKELEKAEKELAEVAAKFKKMESQKKQSRTKRSRRGSKKSKTSSKRKSRSQKRSKKRSRRGSKRGSRKGSKKRRSSKK